MGHFKIGFIGFGKMASALAEGLVRSDANSNDSPNAIKKKDIYFHTRNDIKNEYTRLESNIKVVEVCDIIICAVKPKVAKLVISEIKNEIKEKLFISICAGLTIDQLINELGENKKVVRLMPNLPCAIGEGSMGFCTTPTVTVEDKHVLTNLFSKCGIVKEVEESYMDIITVLAGSAPAFVYLFIESLIDAAVKIGLPRDISKTFALQTVTGSSKLAADSILPVHQLKDNICSPGGTTIEGLYILEKNKFKYSIMEAVDAAFIKCKTISKSV